MSEPYIDERGVTWQRPTAEAYALACRALELIKRDRDDLLALYVEDRYCGKLGGGPTGYRLHKHECPQRRRCQSHPEGCP